MKIGFFGGSFDPVHFGHLIAAQDALESHGLDRLVFVLAAQAPLKPGEVTCAAEDRLAILRTALAGDGRFEISDVEVRRGGISYTIDTARHFRAQFPDDRLFWIVGGDQLPKLCRWRAIEELVQLVEFIAVDRPGFPSEAMPAIPGLRLHRCDGHLVEISSTELRDRIRRGLPIDYFLPHGAASHIAQHQLYRPPHHA